MASCNAHEQAKAWAAALVASGATPAAARVEFNADSPSVMHAEYCTWGGGGGVLAGGGSVAVAEGPENHPCTSASRSVCDWLKKPRPRFDIWLMAKLATMSPPPTELTVEVAGRPVPAGYAVTYPPVPLTEVTL